MELLIKIVAVSAVGAVISLVIKKNSPEMALLLTISVSILVLLLVVGTVTQIVGFLNSLADAAQISPVVLTIVMKTIGIAIVTKLSSDICRDAGQSSAASGVELAGAVTALVIALPLFQTVVGMINSLV